MGDRRAWIKAAAVLVTAAVAAQIAPYDRRRTDDQAACAKVAGFYRAAEAQTKAIRVAQAPGTLTTVAVVVGFEDGQNPFLEAQQIAGDPVLRGQLDEWPGQTAGASSDYEGWRAGLVQTCHRFGVDVPAGW